MKTKIELKDLVKDRYTAIAECQDTPTQGCSCCCGASTTKITDYSNFSDDYSTLEGYVPEADMGLGCGLPTEFAGIKEGNHVLDLGSGAGNDCFVARALTGPNGKVTGLDFTDIMIIKARKNAEKLGFTNVEFFHGDIEEMPFHDGIIDVVISNCVLNLVPDKNKAFSEIYRVLKPGGHFCISDVVLHGTLPPSLQASAEMYAGCVAGALQQEYYLKIISDTGFNNISVVKVKQVEIPDDVLAMIATKSEIESLKATDTGIFSITVTAEK
ncbi:MAG: arsenite methyltransferase [Bacteroidota bacterium]